MRKKKGSRKSCGSKKNERDKGPLRWKRKMRWKKTMPAWRFSNTQDNIIISALLLKIRAWSFSRIRLWLPLKSEATPIASTQLVKVTDNKTPIAKLLRAKAIEKWTENLNHLKSKTTWNTCKGKLGMCLLNNLNNRFLSLKLKSAIHCGAKRRKKRMMCY